MKINRTCVGLSKFSNQFKCGVNKPDVIILPTGLVTDPEKLIMSSWQTGKKESVCSLPSVSAVITRGLFILQLSKTAERLA